MKGLKNVIQKLGISQRSLAKFIGSSNAVISYAISGTRDLPTNALLQLAQLGKLLKTLPAASLPTPTAQDATAIRQQAAWCLAQCHPLKKQLAAMQQNHQQAATLLQVLDAYIANAATISVKQQRWLEEQRYQAQLKMAQNGWLLQQQLQHKIALLTYEANLCKAAIDI
jgi:transcriptional regulator with XRE-family HTH domain